MSLFCYALLCVHSSFAIILKRKRKLIALLLLSYRCIFTINVLWLLLAVPWVGLQCVIVIILIILTYFFKNVFNYVSHVFLEAKRSLKVKVLILNVSQIYAEGDIFK